MFSFYTQAHRKIKRIFALFHRNSCWETTLNLKHHKQFDRKFVLFKKEKKLFRFIVRARPMGNVQTKQCPQWVSLLQKTTSNVEGFFSNWVFVSVLFLWAGEAAVWGFFCFYFSQRHAASPPFLHFFLITDTSIPKWKINRDCCGTVRSFRVHYYNYAQFWM